MYSFTTPVDVRNVLDGRFDDTVDTDKLAEAMWKRDLDPRDDEDLKEGFRLIGLNPDDYGIGR